MDHVRSKPPATPRPRTVEGAKPSERLKALEPLLGHTWEAKGEWAAGDAFHIQSTFEWVPLADAIYVARACAGQGRRAHLLDAYVYHHTGANVLRCLALSNRGGVYEGDLTVLDGGALQLDLKGYEGDRVVPHVVRFDFEKDGTLRHRVWSLKGTEPHAHARRPPQEARTEERLTRAFWSWREPLGLFCSTTPFQPSVRRVRAEPRPGGHPPDRGERAVGVRGVPPPGMRGGHSGSSTVTARTTGAVMSGPLTSSIRSIFSLSFGSTVR